MRSPLLLFLLHDVMAAAGGLTGCGGDTSAMPQTAYCYRTLANVDCYTEPVPQDSRRLVGFIGPPPPPPQPARAPNLTPEVAQIWDSDQLSR